MLDFWKQRGQRDSARRIHVATTCGDEHIKEGKEWRRRTVGGAQEGFDTAERDLLIPLARYFVALRLIVQSKVGAALSAFDKWVPAERPVGVQTKSGRTLRALFVILSLPTTLLLSLSLSHFLTNSHFLNTHTHIRAHAVAAASKTFASSVNSWPSLSVKCLCSWP